jgi:hypothetical protein
LSAAKAKTDGRSAILPGKISCLGDQPRGICQPDAIDAGRPSLSGHIVSHPMKLFREERRILGCFSVLLLLGGCGGPEPECDSLDSRNSLVKIVSDDGNNALVNYAVKNSSSVAAMLSDTKSEAEKLAVLEKARRGAVYALDDSISLRSRNRTTRAVDCTGLLSVTVADTTAQKEIEFKVEQKSDGAILVSVSPFLF